MKYSSTYMRVGLVMASAVAVCRADLYIATFDGSPVDYRLVRQGTELPVARNLRLQDGDMLTVTRSGRTLWIRHSDQDLQLPVASSYRVRDVGQVPTGTSNLMAWLRSWVDTQSSTRTAVTTIDTTTRADEILPLAMPLAMQGGLRIVAGNRPLRLAWQGGYPPFSVRVTRLDGGSRVLEQNGVQPWSLVTEPLDWTPGDYRLEIADRKRQIAALLTVVPAAARPQTPPELQPAGPASPELSVLNALWLAARRGGWAFEAYQVATALAAQYPPARTLRDALEQGQIPAPARAGE